MPLGRYLLIIGVLSKLDVDRENGCIRDYEHAYSQEGGLAVLHGKLAEDDCIVKTAGVDESILVFSGPARLFESQEAAEGGAIGLIEEGDVIEIDIPKRTLNVAVDD